MKKRNALRSFAAVTVAACLGASLFGLAACSGDNGSSAGTAAGSQASSASVDASDQDLLSGTHHAVIQVEGYDPINVELDADAAPITVTNFYDLVSDGYYDGLSFYRIAEDFCLQGGTKGNNPSGNDPSLTPIVGEFSVNGVENPLADDFDRGVIAMARTSAYDSATSTFFITLGNSHQVGPSLNGQYAAFGTIDDDGMATVNQIVADHLESADAANMGVINDAAEQPIIESITWVD